MDANSLIAQDGLRAGRRHWQEIATILENVFEVVPNKWRGWEQTTSGTNTIHNLGVIHENTI